MTTPMLRDISQQMNFILKQEGLIPHPEKSLASREIRYTTRLQIPTATITSTSQELFQQASTASPLLS